jgi:hypothetical protein
MLAGDAERTGSMLVIGAVTALRREIDAVVPALRGLDRPQIALEMRELRPSYRPNFRERLF